MRGLHPVIEDRITTANRIRNLEAAVREAQGNLRNALDDASNLPPARRYDALRQAVVMVGQRLDDRMRRCDDEAPA